MVFMRCMAVLAGILILLFAPQVAPQFAYAVGFGDVPNGKIMVVAMAGSAVLASGFFLAAIIGPSLIRRPLKRILIGLLLSIPFVAASWALMNGEDLSLLSVAAPMLAFAGIVFSAFIWPGATRPRRRYTRSEGLHGAPVPNSHPLK